MGEHRVGLVELDRTAPEAGATSDGRDQTLVGHDRPGVPARLERAGQFPGVPPFAGGEDDEMQTTVARR